MKIALTDYVDGEMMREAELKRDEEILTEMVLRMMAKGMSREVAMSLLARDLDITVEELEHYLKVVKRKKQRIEQLRKKKEKNRAKAKAARKARKRGKK